MDFYQVDTAKALDIRDQHADGGNKPYFKFYKNGAKIDQIDYKSNFNDNMYSLKTKCETHDSKAFAREKYTLARASFKGLKKPYKRTDGKPVVLISSQDKIEYVMNK